MDLARTVAQRSEGGDMKTAIWKGLAGLPTRLLSVGVIVAMCVALAWAASVK